MHSRKLNKKGDFTFAQVVTYVLILIFLAILIFLIWNEFNPDKLGIYERIVNALGLV